MLPQRKKKTGKYFAQKVEYDGIKFDSKLEAARYKILKAREEDGEIENVEDTKGVLTQVFSLKKKLVEALHPGVIVQIIKDPREWPPRTVLDPHPSHAHLRTQHQTSLECSEQNPSSDQDQSWS